MLRIIERHNLLPHLFADDTQVYVAAHPFIWKTLQPASWRAQVTFWAGCGQIESNSTLTRTNWSGWATWKRLLLRPVVPIIVGSTIILPLSSVRDLGIYIDADLCMRTHVSMTTAGCYADLRQIRSVRRSMLTAVIQTLVVSLVLSKLDYCNASLVGIPANLLCCLHTVLNAVARTITYRSIYLV